MAGPMSLLPGKLTANDGEGEGVLNLGQPPIEFRYNCAHINTNNNRQQQQKVSENWHVLHGGITFGTFSTNDDINVSSSLTEGQRVLY